MRGRYVGERAGLEVGSPKLKKVINLPCALFYGEVPEPNSGILLGTEHNNPWHVAVVATLGQKGADGRGLDLREHSRR
jgi:hypothetical protein